MRPSLPTDRAPSEQLVRWFEEIRRVDSEEVGGKAASLGEMYQALSPQGVRVPDGFATTRHAYRRFLTSPAPQGTWESVTAEGALGPLRAEAARSAHLAGALQVLFAGDLVSDHLDLHGRTALARAFVLATPIPPEVLTVLEQGYDALCARYGCAVDAAVRSSATCEDSAVASFAGQYDSFLNVRGVDEVTAAWKRCCSSAFTERAVGYQLSKGMDPLGSDVAVVVMKMVRSDLASSGVIFTIDPDSGNENVLHVTSAYGLGELVVQGTVSPDTFCLWKEGVRKGRPAVVHRSLGAKDRKLVYSMQGGTTTESVDVEAAHQRRWSLTREEAQELGRMALLIEDHYGRPMDIEWAKDGYSGDLFIVQARPETVHSARRDTSVLETYVMSPELLERLRSEGKVLATGSAVGNRIGTGRVRVYDDYEEVIVRKRVLRNALKAGTELTDIPVEERVFDPGDVLVTQMTTPDWEPLMKEASVVITEKGGRTSHAAIVAREFGIPAIVGCEGATKKLKPMSWVTGSCAEGDTGYVYEGEHPFEIRRVEVDGLEDLETQVKLNVGFPDKALEDARLPVAGVGLARLEFILTAQVGVHPLALYYYDELRAFCETGDLPDCLRPFEKQLRAEDLTELGTLVGAIERRTPSYADRRQFFIDQVKYGVALICAAFHPRPVLVRLSDLKSNEYRELLGGRLFEPDEENPMIAWRGAARYVDPRFRPAFEMECEALRFVRQRIGLDNLQLMVPFCRTPEEGREVVEHLDRFGLSPEAGIELFLMVELPSNVLDAERFIEEMRLTGGSIGSNDLVQTVYAVSRDDLEHYGHPVDARSPAVRRMIRDAIATFRAEGLEIGICGQAPSDYPDEIPPFLVESGITSISVTPDTVARVRVAVAEAEARRRREAEPVAAPPAVDAESDERRDGRTSDGARVALA